MDDTTLCDVLSRFVPFLDLPPEIRNRIYTFYFVDTYSYYKLIRPLARGTENSPSRAEADPRDGRWQRELQELKWKTLYDPGLAIFNVFQTNTELLITCKQIYTEALPVYQCTRTFFYTQENQPRFVHIFPYLLQHLPTSFLRSIKHLKITHLQFIHCIDPSFSESPGNGTIVRHALYKEVRDLLATSIFPNLNTFMLQSEIVQHSLRLHYLPTADELHRQILTGDFEITASRVKALTVLKALRMLSTQWPTIQSVIWMFSLFWSVRYTAYGTIHKMERFGWNVYVYDGKLDTLTLQRDESWTAEREAKEH